MGTLEGTTKWLGECTRTSVMNKDWKFQTDRQILANKPGIMVVDKEQMTVVVINVVITSNGNIMTKEHEKLEKYQG